LAIINSGLDRNRVRMVLNNLSWLPKRAWVSMMENEQASCGGYASDVVSG
jgi:hypothetical protein